MSEPEHCQNEKKEEEKLSFFVDLSPEKKTQVGQCQYTAETKSCTGYYCEAKSRKKGTL